MSISSRRYPQLIHKLLRSSRHVHLPEFPKSTDTKEHVLMQPAVAAPAANGQQAQQGKGWLGMIGQMMMMYFMFNYLFKGSGTVKDPSGKVLPPLRNAWITSQRFSLDVFVSESSTFNDFQNKNALIWHESDLSYDWADSNNRETFVEIPISKNVQNNGSLYAHLYFAQTGYSCDPAHSTYNHIACIHVDQRLNRYLPHKKGPAKKNLLSGTTEVNMTENKNEDSKIGNIEIASFWKPNLTIHLIDDHSSYPRNGIPPQIETSLQIDNESSTYLPIVYLDEFWIYKEHLIALNETVDRVPLGISFSPFSLMKWQLYSQMDESFRTQETMGVANEGESDDFKRMLTDTNPYLLGLTFFVTILHSVFDFLAFKNDIHFWKNKKSMEGLSVRTMFLNAVCQIIIFLYLVDNDTSWMIIISSGIGLVIEFWKIRKAVIVEFDRARWFPLTYKDRESYSSKTKEYDEMAMKYLSWALFPCIVGYAIYALFYNEYKSWYSWVLSSLTGCVYTFGFIMMCPQLFINYKLKSVAHLPWRTFAYKALNTFIDDLFAFIIKMPILHRLSCFRDDIIFLIYLYQRWIYRVDYSRVNEFGQGGDDKDDAAAATPATTSVQSGIEPTNTASETEKSIEAKKDE